MKNTTGDSMKIPKLNVILDEATNMKLNNLTEKSGQSRSDVIRDLIDDGNISVIIDGKKMVTEINNLHNSVNQKSLQVSEDIATLRNMIASLQETSNNSEVNNRLRNIDTYLICLQTNYKKDIFVIDSTLNNLINHKER